MTPSPAREVICADARPWLAENPAALGSSVVTSMPDVSELPALGLDGWRDWFVATAGVLLRWVPEEGVAIFYQSDVRSNGVWIDKGYLVAKAAEQAGASLVWHKIVCRRPPGAATLGRASYSHLSCFKRGATLTLQRPTPDVLPSAGAMPWSRAMGVEACRLACRFIRDELAGTKVIDPFCGKGTLLAVANELGLDALGVDISPKRCRAARTLRLDEPLEKLEGNENAATLADAPGPRLSVDAGGPDDER